ncbi:MAG: xanthine dehydrogenase family protein molybdopterin-binding subunit, partial [Steroidobacteraceae bacterium]
VQSSYIGQPMARVEDDALVRGQGRYMADLSPAGVLHAAFVRSPVARATLNAVNGSAAGQYPGVLLVLTGPMVATLGPLSVNCVVPDFQDFRAPLLAQDRLNAVGEAVALVVAETLDAAQEAAELVELDYDSEEAQATLASAANGQPLYSNWTSNEAFSQRWSCGDVQAAFDTAARVVEVEVDMPRVAPVPLETRGTLAAWSAQTGILTIWLGTQTPHRARAELARILGLELAAVQVISPDVGGAFGGKAAIYPEDVLVAAASIRLGRPVKWIASRNEDFVSASHGRGGHISATAAVDSQGRMLAIRARLEFPLGCWATFSAAVPALNAARILPGPYRVPALDIHMRGLLTNTAPVGIYRGAGRPEAALVMERLIEKVAAASGLDPAEARRRNLLSVQDLPYAMPTGERLDSGDYHSLLEHALRAIDYTGLRSIQVMRRAAGEIFGIGLCIYVEPCGKGWESARICARGDGTFLVASGTSSQGQGHRTALAQIAADCLAVPFERIEMVEGDTAVTPEGVGALASRSIAIGGSAIKRAATELLARIAAAGTVPTGPLEVTAVYTAAHEAWSCGCAVATVAIDPETGELRVEKLLWVDDAGLVINPLLVEGQLLGGLAQGLGQVLCEKIHYDADGQLLTGSLMDYALLRADQMPDIELHSVATATDANILGAKGVGESGCIVAPALVLNAALDALSPLGITDLPLPLSSENIWLAMQRAPLKRAP